MQAIPISLEEELRNGLYVTLRGSTADPPYTGVRGLPAVGTTLTYQFEYDQGEANTHVVALLFRLSSAELLSAKDVSSIERELTRIVRSKLSFSGTIDFEQDQGYYVYNTQVKHSFHD